jgi:non-ribosomal peptide synthetase component F
MRMFTVRRAGVIPRQNWGIGFSSRALQKVPSARRGLLTQSYACGPREPPLIDSTVGDHFACIVSQYGDREAVISKHQNHRLTYASLDAKSNALARGLESVGVRKGDRVGVMLGNSSEYAIVCCLSSRPSRELRLLLEINHT